VPFQSNHTELISRVTEHTTLSTCPLWWKGPQWLTQEPSSWPITEVNTSTGKLEIRKVHVAFQQLPENITQKFSKLNSLIQDIAYCRIFINNCRNYKANRRSTTLSIYDLDQALTCCVKIVQQISYAQQMKNLMEQQEVATNNSLKTLHPFIDKESLLRVGDDYDNP